MQRLLLFFLLLPFAAAAAPLPSVRVLSTGGTIAGRGASSTTLVFGDESCTRLLVSSKNAFTTDGSVGAASRPSQSFD